jgi:phosphatidylglycerol---prolipoprotein diacylglyceryl transferase
LNTSHFVWNQNPVIFDLNFYQLHYYTLFFVAGIIAASLIIKSEFSKQNYDDSSFEKLFIYSMFGIVLGARLGHCLFYEFSYYSQHLLEIILPVRFTPQFEIIGYKGLASHGGGIGLLLAIFLFSISNKISFLKLLDMFSLAAPVTAIFIRIGNFFNSEIIGKSSDLFCAVIFERVDNVPRHPAQLYEAFAYLLIFVLLILIKKQKKYLVPGIPFSLFIILLFTVRFIIEFVKENQTSFESHLPINMGQILSIPYILLGIVLLIWLSRKRIMFTP